MNDTKPTEPSAPESAFRQELIDIENELDKKFAQLGIWKMSFQSIISWLFSTIDNIDLTGRTDSAMDYASRLSYVYKGIASHAKSKAIVNTSEAIGELQTFGSFEDVKFIIAYAHFCMLMPQVHRDAYTIKKNEARGFRLEYASDSMRKAELIDRLYSFVSMQMALQYNDTGLKDFLRKKVGKGSHSMDAEDFRRIELMYEHFLKMDFTVRVLRPAVFETAAGISYEEYFSFIAVVRAYAHYFKLLGRAYYEKIDRDNPTGLDDGWMNEYMEWTTCCLNYKVLGWMMATSDLTKEKFYTVLSYFINIYSNNTGEQLTGNAFCGDGFLPPFILMDQSIIFSSTGIGWLLNINNILFSINKNQKKHFDELVSADLEPTLVAQMEYIFSFLPGVKAVKNVIYGGGEIDFMLFSEAENCCLAVQAKATIAPDSFRTVARVEDRVLEGMQQIIHFDKLDQQTKDAVINKAFGFAAKDIKVINLLAVRSSAGSEKAWLYNERYKIVNYSILARIIAGKIDKGDNSIINFSKDISGAQEELITMSGWKEEHELLQIGDIKIEIPFLNIDMTELVSYNLQAYAHFRDFGEAS